MWLYNIAEIVEEWFREDLVSLQDKNNAYEKCQTIGKDNVHHQTSLLRDSRFFLQLPYV